MLNTDAMAQLKGLKDQLEAQKEHTEATVKGTQNRYGFAVVDDGREIFLPPDEMLKVLPGDRVAICIRPASAGKGGKAKSNKDTEGRTVADVERRIQSPLDRFVGKIVNKGKAVFVEPDMPNLSRWLFVPPHARNGAKPGDRVECAVLKHPIQDGKPSAKVLQLIGSTETAGLENRYCAARAGLAWTWPEKAASRLIEHAKKQTPLEDTDRTDLTHLAFISIDAVRTQDIDDALYAEVTADGWLLYVAVADPTSYLGDLKDIREELTARGTSVYFHGDMIAMLPEEISHDFCALAENQLRPALVCKITLSDEGEVGSYEFLKASIRSRAKLSYAAVDRYVTKHNDELIAFSTPLEALVQAYRALRRRREANELVMEERREYRWLLDEQRQIESIETFGKMASQNLVEECMIAANRCAAHFLAMGDASGPFVVHGGFRKDRIAETKEFLSRHRPDLADAPFETIAGYRQVLAGLASSENTLPLRGMVNRLLMRAELSTAPSEHMGMALQAYTNFTSPLRKAVDFLVHLQIKALLNANPGDQASDAHLRSAAQAIAKSREASFAAERWLAANYLNKLVQNGKTRFDGTVCNISSSGFTVRLADNGLEGFVDLRKDPEKFSFDKWTASLTSTTRRFQLDQVVDVDFIDAPECEGFVARFELVSNSGLKAVKVS